MTMITHCRNMLAGAVLLLSIPAFADDSHHPSGSTTAAPPATPAAAPSEKPNAGMMMTGSMMDGMMSDSMMSDGMMKMMMDMMSGGEGPMGMMMSPDHVEGRIAFLQAELKLTDKQEHLWHRVADALRENARSTKEMMANMPNEMMPGGAATDTPLVRIDAHERMLSTRLEALQRLKVALEPFYASLDDTQKAVADKLLMPAPMGMM